MPNINDKAGNIKRLLNKELNVKVSVALFGQPGSGKSSLVNKLVGEKVAEVGVETDKTVEAAEYEAKGLRFVDLPGYGTKHFPKDTYFKRFNIPKFDLFLCVTSGKLHQADTEFFQELIKLNKVCIFVVNKHDELWEDDANIEELEKRKVEDITRHTGREVKIIFTSCRLDTGLNTLDEEVYSNLNEAKRERWARSAKAYSLKFLEEKKAASEKHVILMAGLAAANGLNPVPGADVAVDFGILLKLFKEIREDFGLDDEALSDLKHSSMPTIVTLANNAIEYATKEGLLILFKKAAGKRTVKEFSKYVPFVGQVIAASIGFAITFKVGNSYLDDSYKLAEEVLKRRLQSKK